MNCRSNRFKQYDLRRFLTPGHIFILLAIIFLCPENAQANILHITVLEKGSGDPVEGATVVIKQSNEYTTTNNQGILSFEDISFPIDIKVLNTGYATLEQKVTTNELILYLEPLSFDGEVLEVIAERVKEKTSKITLNPQELRRVPGTQGDPIKMLETLPGVITNSAGGGGGNDPNAIYVRGSSGGENSFWINRLPTDYLYHLWGISVVNPSLVKDFNIFLGGFPVEYDDVLGGVVDIQLRNPKTDRLHQTYRIALNESAALIEGPINEQQSFYLAGRISYIDKALNPFIDDLVKLFQDDESDDDISVITLPKYWDVQANWHYELPKGSADLYYFGSGDALAININQLDTLDPEILGKLSVDFGFHTLGFSLRKSLSATLATHITSALKRSFQRQSFGTDEDGKPFGIDVVVNTGLLHPQAIWTPLKNHEFTFGSQINYATLPISLNISSFPTEENFVGNNFSSLEKRKIDETINFATTSPYLKWRWTWNKFSTTLGARYSKIRGTGGINLSGYSPRTSIEYQATKRLLLTSSWGRYIQIPSGAQLLRNYGNPRLSFTEAEHRIVGLQYRFSKLWMAQLEAYHKPMEKLVLTRPLETPPNNYRNDGTGEAYGTDLLIKRDYGNRKMGWLSYSYAKSSRTLINGIGRDFSGDQPHTISVVWSQPFTGSWNKWTWGFKLQANSGQPYTPIVGRVAMCGDGTTTQVCADQENADADPSLSYWNPIYGKRNSLRYPFAHKLDIRIDRLIRYNTWKMTLYLDLLNVTLQQSVGTFDYGKNYEDYNNPKTSGFPPIIFPFFGIEATF